MKTNSQISAKAAIHRTSTQPRLRLTRLCQLMSLGCIATLAACGGAGGDSDKVSAASTEISSDKALVSGLMSRAAAAGIKKEVFSIGNAVGTYGVQLQAAGWTLKPVADMAAVPNIEEAMVYVSSNSTGLDKQKLVAQLVGFKGTLIVDSDQTKKSFAPDYASPGDTNNIESLSSGATSAAGALLYELSAGKVGSSPKATAIMISRTTNTMMGLDVDDAGNVNGYDAKDIDAVSPMMYALNAKDIAQGLAKPSTYAADMRKELSGDKVAAQGAADVDYTVDFNKTLNGFVMRGRFYVYAYRDLGPAYSSARKFVQIRIDTGSADSSSGGNGCLIGGQPCGVYPTSTAANVPILAVGTTGNIVVGTPPWRYAAIAEVDKAKSVISYSPTVEYWNGNDAKTTDSWDTTWSVGYSYGPSISASLAQFALPISVGFSGSTSYSQTFKKRTLAWKGHMALTDSSLGYHISSGIDSVNNKIRMAIPTYAAVTTTSGDAYNKLSKALINGTYVDCNVPESSYCHASDLSVQNTDGSVRSKIAYAGWRPALTVVFEIPSNTFASTSSTNTITARAGVTIDRSRWHLNKVSVQAYNGAGYTTGFANDGYTSRLGQKGQVMSNTYANDHFGADNQIEVRASNFNN